MIFLTVTVELFFNDFKAILRSSAQFSEVVVDLHHHLRVSAGLSFQLRCSMAQHREHTHVTNLPVRVVCPNLLEHNHSAVNYFHASTTQTMCLLLTLQELNGGVYKCNETLPVSRNGLPILCRPIESSI